MKSPPPVRGGPLARWLLVCAAGRFLPCSAAWLAMLNGMLVACVISRRATLGPCDGSCFWDICRVRTIFDRLSARACMVCIVPEWATALEEVCWIYGYRALLLRRLVLGRSWCGGGGGDGIWKRAKEWLHGVPGKYLAATARAARASGTGRRWTGGAPSGQAVALATASNAGRCLLNWNNTGRILSKAV